MILSHENIPFIGSSLGLYMARFQSPLFTHLLLRLKIRKQKEKKLKATTTRFGFRNYPLQVSTRCLFPKTKKENKGNWCGCRVVVALVIVLLVQGRSHGVYPLMSGNRLRIARVGTNLYAFRPALLLLPLQPPPRRRLLLLVVVLWHCWACVCLWLFVNSNQLLLLEL